LLLINLHDKEDKFAAGFYILKIMYLLPFAQFGQSFLEKTQEWS
jgi:hypothetical protein